MNCHVASVGFISGLLVVPAGGGCRLLNYNKSPTTGDFDNCRLDWMLLGLPLQTVGRRKRMTQDWQSNLLCVADLTTGTSAPTVSHIAESHEPGTWRIVKADHRVARKWPFLTVLNDSQ
ncbi:MAG: hypothetical protein CMJ75_18050 [Planctomycetaceae bacterium]|nr:hypothetical protein [Planctomycetaceae bacterium]